MAHKRECGIASSKIKTFHVQVVIDRQMAIVDFECQRRHRCTVKPTADHVKVFVPRPERQIPGRNCFENDLT